MRILSVVLGIALVAVGGLAINQSRKVDAANQRIADLEAQLQARPPQSMTLADAVPSLSLPPATPVQPEPSSVMETTPAPAPAPASSGSLPDVETLLRVQRNSPEGRARLLERQRNSVRTANADVDEALDLTPEETEHLLELLVAQQQRSTDAIASARDSADLEAERRQVSDRLEEIRRTNEVELQQLLGSKYARWQEYQQTRPVWQQRRDLRVVLEAAGTPLTESQGRSLISALSAEYLSMRNMRESATSPFLQHTPERRQRLLNAASAHLTAQQLDGYRQMLERAAMQDEVMLRPLLRASESPAAAQPAPAN